MDEIATCDWVPELARGYVRNLRIRWACDEAGQPCRIETTAGRDKTPEYFARQPCGRPRHFGKAD